MFCNLVAKERNNLIGYSINTLYDEILEGLHNLYMHIHPVGNHKHTCALHVGVYINFRWHLNPVGPSV